MRFKFDLKGSMYKRRTITKGITKKEWNKTSKVEVLKDVDLQEMLLREPNIINLTLESRVKIIK